MKLLSGPFKIMIDNPSAHVVFKSDVYRDFVNLIDSGERISDDERSRLETGFGWRRGWLTEYDRLVNLHDKMYKINKLIEE